jgi:ATP-dependent helicase HrpB
LRELDALDSEGHVTEKGKRLAQLPLPPRLAAMVVSAAGEDEALFAAEIAAVVSERGLGGDDVDLAHRVENFRRDRSRRAADARQLARRWAEEAGGKLRETAPAHAGSLLALAFPDRIGMARAGKFGEFLLENGRGARVDRAHSFARDKFLAVAEVAGIAAEARILLAARISEEEIERCFAAHIVELNESAFDEKSASLRGRAVRRLGALVLEERPLPIQVDEQSSVALAQGIANLGLDRLPWSAGQRQLLDRVRFMRGHEGDPWPDLSDAALAATATNWLAPALTGRTALNQINADDLARAIQILLPHDLVRRLEKEMPSHFTAPTGSRIAIDYESDGGPTVTLRVQELFGLDAHPSIAGGKLPLTLALTSPAGRPIQVTKDLPAFWRGSWADVRRDMRGRYPKHPWPEDPRNAPPTRRAKPRGT